MLRREIIFSTPVPETVTENGRRVTRVVSTPLGAKEPDVVIIDVGVGRPFRFDIDFPGEDLRILTYELTRARRG